MGSSTTINAYFLSVIAVLGTLLGAVTAGAFQHVGMRRQLRWQAKEAELRRVAELEHWAHTAIEERQQALWAERRRIYGDLIAAAEAWMTANGELAAASPPRAPVENARDAYVVSLREMELLGHESIVPFAEELHISLVRAEKAALEGVDERESTEKDKARVLRAMRHHLTRVQLPNDPNAAVRRGHSDSDAEGRATGIATA